MFYGAQRGSYITGELRPVALFRMAISPMETPDSRNWQQHHRAEMLQKLAAGNWAAVTDMINEQDATYGLPPELRELWAHDWPARTATDSYLTPWMYPNELERALRPIR